MRIFIILFLLVYTSTYSQSGSSPSGGNVPESGFFANNQLHNNLSKVFLNSENKAIKYEDIEGSPYIDNSFKTNPELSIGRIYNASLELISDVHVRYNAYTDDMEVSLIDNGADYQIFKKQEDYVYIILNTKKYRCYKYGDSVFGFFIIISKNDVLPCTLLKKEKIIFKDAIKPKNTYSTKTTPPTFKRLKDIYYFKLQNTIIEIPKNKKNFFSVFGERQTDIKNYINNKKLKLTNENDLLDIANYYNSLNL